MELCGRLAIPLPGAHLPSCPQELPVSSRLLSIPAVAAALDVDRRTVYRFIASGDLPVVDLRTGSGRSRVRVPVVSLDEFINSRTVGPAAARR
ncbi:helix-turn-helix domain-containing protein [Streptomyces globisporus]|uniref:helix-turn-helix domain-containing protein n=1 Tax=Streptomyces globisporus TaxID=1908 RepID=UPI002D21B9A4|nr:helix-turn-helix domain-containing protein [Streptomyces globisporus]